MLIECRQRRDAKHVKLGRKDNDVGSKPNLFGTRYWFRPQPELTQGGDVEAHVCEIEDQRAIDRLLSLPEAFNEFGRPPQVPAKVEPASGQPEIVTEIIDDDEPVPEDDGAPVVVDEEPDVLAEAKKLQAEWIKEVLDQPVHQIQTIASTANDDELDALIEAEKADKNRKGAITAFEENKSDAGGEDLAME